MQSETIMEYIEPRPAIEIKAGWKEWCQQNLFSSVFNTLLTITGLLFVIWLVPTLLNWFISMLRLLANLKQTVFLAEHAGYLW